jgi:signal transduction histidine kinase
VNTGDLHFRVLVLAHFGRDKELLQSFLARNGFFAQVVDSLDQLLSEVRRGAATALVTQESLTGAVKDLITQLEKQQPWSDFPLIVLTGAKESSDALVRLAELRTLGNVTLVERPIRSENLLSAIESAMRARLRQYQLRDFVRRQAESEEALRRTEKLALAGRLAASVAHEINNPLSAVTNLLYLIRSARDLPEALKYAHMAEDELRRVAEIANHTLRFHRSSTGPEKVEVAKLLDSAVVLFRAKLRNQNINVKVECEAECTAVFQPGEIRQVLVNLIANAIDAMPNGGALHLRGGYALHPGTSACGIRISVADHGAGVPREVGGKVFEPFFTTKGDTGTGLGLWLTKDIIERHHGYVKSRNHKHPHGAVFSVWIPEKPVDAALDRAQEPSRQEA